MSGNIKLYCMEDFKEKVAVVRGGAQGIGRCITDEFLKVGAQVCVIDKQEGDHFVGDITMAGNWKYRKHKI